MGCLQIVKNQGGCIHEVKCEKGGIVAINKKQAGREHSGGGSHDPALLSDGDQKRGDGLVRGVEKKTK